MRVIRLLIYDGPDESILEQLGRSLPDGVKHHYPLGCTITAVTLPQVAVVALSSALTAIRAGQQHAWQTDDRLPPDDAPLPSDLEDPEVGR